MAAQADEAGPSGAPRPVDDATLAEATAKFERGIQCIRTNDIEVAVGLFAEVLEVRTRHYGELAPECASAYYRYGAALLYQAQDSGDVFGAGVGEEEEEEEEPGAENKENGGGKGKAPVVARDDAEDEDEESGDAGGTDLQLAWENLEAAKVIWSRAGKEAHAQQLADVHGLLGEVAMESDDFTTATAELDAALAHLAAFVQPDDRRIAEVQYKRCCALQFGGELGAALPAVQAAIDCLSARRASLAARLAAPGEGDDAAKLTAESEEVGALLGDLREKVAELRDLIAQDADTKSMLRGAFAQLAAAGGGGGAAPGGAAPGGGAAPAGGVQNLGVVGLHQSHQPAAGADQRAAGGARGRVRRAARRAARQEEAKLGGRDGRRRRRLRDWLWRRGAGSAHAGGRARGGGAVPRARLPPARRRAFGVRQRARRRRRAVGRCWPLLPLTAVPAAVRPNSIDPDF